MRLFLSVKKFSVSRNDQKQPPELYYKKAVFKNFGIFTGKHQCLSFFLIKNKVGLQHRCFPVNIAKF